MPSIDLVIKLIGTQDVRKWDNPTLLLWALEMAKEIESNQKPKLCINEILQVLARQIGDHRICPKCNHSFMPHDETANEAMSLYGKLKNG